MNFWYQEIFWAISQGNCKILVKVFAISDDDAKKESLGYSMTTPVIDLSWLVAALIEHFS